MEINQLHNAYGFVYSITRIIVITLLSVLHIESWAQAQDNDSGIVFEQGGIDIFGNNANRNDRVRTNMIAVDGDFTVTLADGYQYNFFYYGQDGVFDYRDGNTFLRGTQQRSYFGFIRILIAPVKGSSITTEEDFELNITGKVDLNYEEKNKAVNSLPSYYGFYMLERLDKIIHLEYHTENNNSSFVFLTDTHLSGNSKKAPALIRSVLSVSGSDRVFWGGDAIPAYTASNTPEECKEAILSYWAQQKSWFTDSLADVAKVYALRGNHDMTIKMQSASGSSVRDGKGYTFSQSEVQEMICGFFKDREEVVFNPYEKGCYYYVDNPIAKVRYLALDGDSRENISGNYAWGNNEGHGISEEQLAWVKNEVLAKMPDGYALIVFCHEGLMDITYPNISNLSRFKKMAAELERFANRQDEYSTLAAAPVVVMNGHKHQDLQCIKNGILHVGTACEAPMQDYRYSMFLDDAPKRVKGTITESLFDYVIPEFNNDQFHCVRIGAGYDRDFHLKPVKMRVGERLSLKPQHLQAAYWQSYDVEGNAYDYGTKEWTIQNSIVAIRNGIIAPQKEGDAMIFAQSEDGHKEFWCIHVEGELSLEEYQAMLAACVATADSLLEEMTEPFGEDLRATLEQYNREWSTPEEYGIAIDAIESAIAVAKEMMDNMANGIRDIQSRRGDNKDVIYNLQGQRVVKPTKGIYIVNGKKMICR